MLYSKARITETSNLKQTPLIWHKQKILLTLAWTRFRIPLGTKKKVVPNILLAIAMELSLQRISLFQQKQKWFTCKHLELFSCHQWLLRLSDKITFNKHYRMNIDDNTLVQYYDFCQWNNTAIFAGWMHLL